MSTEEILLEIGLSKNEARTYLALLSLGKTQAGAIIKQTRLHRMLVYNALESLQVKGLVTVQVEKKVKLFQASNPEILEEKAQKITRLVSEAIPDLHRIQKSHGDTVSVTTLTGHAGLVTNLEQLISSATKQKDRTIRIIGGAKDVDAYEAFGDWYPEYVKLLELSRVKKLLLAPADGAQVFRKKFLTEKDTILKTLPHGLTSPTYTRITEEMVSIEMYKPQIIIIQIVNKVIARSYLDSFELLWQAAGKAEYSVGT